MRVDTDSIHPQQISYLSTLDSALSNPKIPFALPRSRKTPVSPLFLIHKPVAGRVESGHACHGKPCDYAGFPFCAHKPPRQRPPPNSFAAFFMRSATGTLKGQRLSQLLHPMHSSAWRLSAL